MCREFRSQRPGPLRLPSSSWSWRPAEMHHTMHPPKKTPRGGLSARPVRPLRIRSRSSAACTKGTFKVSLDDQKRATRLDLGNISDLSVQRESSRVTVVRISGLGQPKRGTVIRWGPGSLGWINHINGEESRQDFWQRGVGGSPCLALIYYGDAHSPNREE